RRVVLGLAPVLVQLPVDVQRVVVVEVVRVDLAGDGLPRVPPRRDVGPLVLVEVLAEQGCFVPGRVEPRGHGRTLLREGLQPTSAVERTATEPASAGARSGPTRRGGIGAKATPNDPVGRVPAERRPPQRTVRPGIAFFGPPPAR